MKLFKNVFLRWRVGSFLDDWKSNSSVEGFDQFTVKRWYDKYDFFVDVYWQIKRRDNSKKVETVYRRINNSMVRNVIRHMEKEELPRILEYYAKKMKS